jgi:predicted GNAT family N-acyltransferase
LNYKTEVLSSKHNRKQFDCGVASLTRYLQNQASQDQKRKVAACFVLSESEKVLGYYTLSSASVGLEKLPSDLQKKLPRYPQIPATLMGRLAIDQSARGRRLGEKLLFDAMFRALDASQAVASFAVLVDALDIEPDPLPFYEQYGFERLDSGSRTLYVPMKTIAKLPR